MKNLALPVITLTSSFCTMSYAMIMAGIMTDFTGEEIITQCLTMGPYLLGLGLGSGFGDKINPSRWLKAIWGLEWLSVLILPLIPLIQLVGIFLFINLSPHGISLESKEALQFLLGMTAVLAFLTGILGGAQLPMILKTENSVSQEWTLAINYMGPLLAGFTIVAMNQNAMALSLQIYFVGLVQLAGLLLLVTKFSHIPRSLALLFIPLLILITIGLSYPLVEKSTIKSSYMGTKISWKDLFNPTPLFNLLRRYGSVERVKTPYQTIDLFIEPPELMYSIPGNASLYLNRKPQFDLFSVKLYHESMVYGGLNLLKESPRNVLILGGGDGLLLRELEKAQINEIKMIELDKKMLEWSATNLTISQLNEGVLENFDRDQRIIAGDAVSWLRTNKGKKKFHLILVDFPFPNGHELAKLYSFEFYRILKASLSEDGVVIIDLPLYLNQEGDLSKESLVILKTMKAAGFDHPLLFGPSASFVALSGRNEELAFDYDSFPKGLELATYLNFLDPFNEEEITKDEWKKIDVNTMFWPKGL